MYQIQRGSAQFRYAFSQVSQLEQFLAENKDGIGVSFIGRSNVGKSSLINTIFGKGTARVSKTPGRTREINIFEFTLVNEKQHTVENLWLFDLPGYGHAEVSKEMGKNWNLLMSTFFEMAPERVKMVTLQDARHPIQKADIEFTEYFKSYPFECSLVFNKIDKLKRQKDRAVLNKLKPQIMRDYKWVKDIHFVSAEKGTGVKALQDSMITYFLGK